MIKSNIKQFYFLIFLFFALSVLIGQVFIKYNSFLFRTPVYYCQHAWCSDLIRISIFTGTTLFKILALTVFVTLIKTFLDLLKIFRLRRALIQVKKTNQKLDKVTKEIDLEDRVIIVDHQNPFAFCLGFFRPKVVISTAMIKLLSRDELKTVLIHERSHLKNSDALTMFIAFLTKSIFPFFPIFNDQAKRLALEKEINADKLAVQTIGNCNPLVSTFRKLLSSEVVPAYSTYPSFLDSERNLELRIRALTGKEESFHHYSWKNTIISLSSIVLILGLKYVPLNTVNINNADTKEVIACINDKTCIKACQREKQETDGLFSRLHPQTTQ